MKKCRNCGNRFDDRYRYCNMCGSDAPDFSSFGSVMLSILKGAAYFSFFEVMQVIAVVFFAIAATVGAFISGSRDDLSSVSESLLSHTCLISLVSAILTAVLLFIFFTIRKKNFFKELKIGRFVYWTIPLILIFGVAANFFTSYTISLIPVPEGFLDNYNEIYSFLGEENIIIEFLSVAIFAPIVEELTFRGLLYGSVRKTSPAWFAALVSAVIFGIAHGNALSFFYTLILGLLLAYLYEKSASLLVPMLLHIGFNAGSYLVEAITVEEDIVSYALVLVISGIVTVAAGAVVIYAHRDKTMEDEEDTEDEI